MNKIVRALKRSKFGRVEILNELVSGPWPNSVIQNDIISMDFEFNSLPASFIFVHSSLHALVWSPEILSLAWRIQHSPQFFFWKLLFVCITFGLVFKNNCHVVVDEHTRARICVYEGMYVCVCVCCAHCTLSFRTAFCSFPPLKSQINTKKNCLIKRRKSLKETAELQSLHITFRIRWITYMLVLGIERKREHIQWYDGDCRFSEWPIRLESPKFCSFVSKSFSDFFHCCRHCYRILHFFLLQFNWRIHDLHHDAALKKII